MCVVYVNFSKEWEHMCDYSDESMMEMFVYESFGEGSPDNTNGYFLGKKWMDVSVEMWREDIEKGLLFKQELYDCPHLPDWWIKKVLKDVVITDTWTLDYIRKTMLG
jgi:hypothetical protein